MPKYNIFFLFLFLLALAPLVSADFETRFLCGGDLETQFLCFGDLETGGGIYAFGELNLNIINPEVGVDEKSNPVNFLVNTSHVATCLISIDGGSNISMNSLGNNYHDYSLALSNGNHSVDFYCEDIFGETVSGFVNFDVYLSSSGSPGDVFLDKEKYQIIVDTTKFWYYDRVNNLDIKIYDDIAQITPVSSLNYSFVNSTDYGQEDLILNLSLVEEGRYLGELQVFNRNITNLTIQFEANKNGQLFYENVTKEIFEFGELSFFQKYQRELIVLILMLMLVLCLILFFIKRRREEEEN